MIRSIEHLKKMAHSGDSEAWCYLGYTYEDAALYDKAFECYKKGASLGDERAIYNLALAYYAGGRFTKKDRHRTEELLEEAYKKGSGISACALGIIYFCDQTSESIDKAVKWLTAAAEMGETEAMLFLALKIHISDDYRMNDFFDRERGIELLEKAASCGSRAAMLFLFDLYDTDKKSSILKAYLQACPKGTGKVYVDLKKKFNKKKGRVK